MPLILDLERSRYPSEVRVAIFGGMVPLSKVMEREIPSRVLNLARAEMGKVPVIAVAFSNKLGTANNSVNGKGLCIEAATR